MRGNENRHIASLFFLRKFLEKIDTSDSFHNILMVDQMKALNILNPLEKVS